MVGAGEDGGAAVGKAGRKRLHQGAGLGGLGSDRMEWLVGVTGSLGVDVGWIGLIGGRRAGKAGVSGWHLISFSTSKQTRIVRFFVDRIASPPVSCLFSIVFIWLEC